MHTTARLRADLTIRAVRLWFALAGRLAPALAERQAATLFLTPRRRTVREPAIEGLAAHRRTFEVEGHHVAGWSWGEGPVVLLLHGWSGRAADMAVLAAALVREGYQAVTIDWPAHGRSSGRHTSLVEWVKVLLSIGPRLGEDGDVLHAVVAHSFGAAAVVLALEAGLVARGAVLLAPARGPARFLERARRFIGLPAARAAGMERRVAERVGRELAFYDAARAAAVLELPALILHDPADREIPWSDAEAIARAWRGSRLAPAQGDGHYRILGSSNAIGQVVEFLRHLRAGE